ncbi:hypothetical protein GCM10009850_031800 [Nonomuraea monospora]|uniref:Uncharacterized protein n=1 Tax=Nonomuraea monospora TaxID=568818 RepID=A0ABN3CEA6_9ACTN
MPLLELGHHGLRQRRLELEPVRVRTEGVRPDGHGPHCGELPGDPLQSGVIGIEHPLSVGVAVAIQRPARDSPCPPSWAPVRELAYA